jgi:hypothetical protein
VLLAGVLALAGSAPASFSEFQADLEALTARPNRLAGREDGSRAASYYVEKRLREMGFADHELFIQEFDTVQPRTTQCQMIVDGQTYDIYAARPNSLQLSITPAEGLEGQTLYVGRGELTDYGSESPSGRIVVLDLDCDLNWVKAFAFAAKAVVFVGQAPEDPRLPRPWQHLNLPANLPRFYVPYELAAKLGINQPGVSRQVKLVAAARWEQLKGRNVIAVIRGSAPVFQAQYPAEAFVLAAPLDSLSEAPELSPGARDAANVAALLQAAQQFRQANPRRDVILCFFDGQAINHLGARAFYGALYRRADLGSYKPLDLKKQREQLQKEQAYYQRLLELYNEPDIFASAVQSKYSSEKLYDFGIRLLQDEAKRIGDSVLERLSPLRRQLRKLELHNARDPQVEVLRAAVDDLDRQDLAWNFVQRDLNKRSQKGLTEHELNRLTELGRGIVQRRLAELEEHFQTNDVNGRLLEALGPKRNSIIIHFSFNLGDAGKRWTFIHGEDSLPLLTDSTGNYNGIFKTMTALAAQLGAQVAGFDERAVAPTFGNRIFTPGKFVDSSAVARIFARWNLAVMTTLDRMDRQGLPLDTLSRLDSQAIYQQARQATLFLSCLADHPDMSISTKIRADVRYGDAEWTGGKAVGASVRQAGESGAMVTHTVRNAVVEIIHNGLWAGMAVDEVPGGFEQTIRLMTNAHGLFEFGPYCPSHYNKQHAVQAATFDHSDPLTGQLGPDSRGLIDAIVNSISLPGSENLPRSQIQIRRCKTQTVVGQGFDRGVAATTTMRALMTSAFPKDRSLTVEWLNVLALYVPPDTEGMKLFNSRGMVLLNNQPTKAEYRGQGISLDDPFEHPVTLQWTPHDLRTLNEHRLKVLRDVRIRQDSLETLSGSARDLEEDALARRGQGQASLDNYAGMEAASGAFSRLVYHPLMGVMNDLVTAVVLLMLLAIPFAYAIERLLIGTPHIYRQIGWFAVFFLLTFGLLYAVNPAFKIASTPVIIFLAFAIILLSAMVIFIMVRKLQTEVRRMQGLATTVHSADVSRLSTMMAAVNMGISTMRRRPLRTLLTAATVVLLTFTILTFASFGSEWDIRPTYQGAMTSLPARILVRHPLWSPISRDVYETLRGCLAQDALVAPCWWASPTAQQANDAVTQGLTLDMVLSTPDGTRMTRISAAIGMASADLQRQPEQLGSLLQAGPDANAPFALIDETRGGEGIYLTQAVADELGLDAARDAGQAKVRLAGLELTFAGIADDHMATYTLLEGSSILPVDYEASAGEATSQFTQATTTSLTEQPDIESAQFVTFNVDKVVVVSPRTARRLGGTIRSLTIYPHPGKVDSIRKIGDQTAKVSGLPVYVGDPSGGVSRLIFTSVTRASGWRDLLIPVVLGGLIIFATMLGSVSDREREIYTFSSLGLAPAHVASLFFAEASMYAVVGGMGGYLLGQVVASLLAWMSGAMGWSVPSMNYSSTNAIVTIVIVMCTVLVSTIYPAVKASRSANPGIQRAWRIPRPDGNLYDLVFPFTVSAYDITGVVSFLREHFDNYSDTSLGVFATTESHVFRQPNDMLGICATVALAPFDLGVNQTFAMLSQPSDIQGIDEVRILIQRLSGAQGDWQRSNRVFINDLRKQLLIWRSLPVETMDHYRQKTLQQWNELGVEEVTPQSIGGDA